MSDDTVQIDPPEPKKPKRSSKKPPVDILEAGTKSCLNCEHFHPGDGKLDNAEWGECWRFPQVTETWTDEDGNDHCTGIKAVQVLPYYCGELRPRH